MKLYSEDIRKRSQDIEGWMEEEYEEAYQEEKGEGRDWRTYEQQLARRMSVAMPCIRWSRSAGGRILHPNPRGPGAWPGLEWSWRPHSLPLEMRDGPEEDVRMGNAILCSA